MARDKKLGLIERARSAITEGIGGFRKREARQALQRSTVSQPFTGAPGQRARRQALIGKAPVAAPAPIIKKKKKKSLSETLRGRSEQINKAAGI
jgi:hypothetical protein